MMLLSPDIRQEDREENEERKMTYYVSIEDFWAISKGKLLG